MTVTISTFCVIIVILCMSVFNFYLLKLTVCIILLHYVYIFKSASQNSLEARINMAFVDYNVFYMLFAFFAFNINLTYNTLPFNMQLSDWKH